MAIERLYPDTSVEQLPPHNVDAEEAVLGSILLDREAISLTAAFLEARDFYRDRNGLVYQTMLDLYDRHEPIDYLTLISELDRSGRIEQVGGVAYLSGLLGVVPTPVHVERYARLVSDSAFMRRLISAGGKIAAIGFQNQFEPDVALERSEQLLFEVANRRARGDFQPLSEILREYLDQLALVREGEQIRYGVPTGFIDLDKITAGGFQKSDLVILAARPSMGKSSLALNIASNAALKFKATVAVFSLEMSKGQLAARLLATESGVDTTRLRTAQLSEVESRRLGNALALLAEAKIYVDDTPSVSVTNVRARTRRLYADVPLDLVIVDHLQLMTSGRSGENRVQEMSEISRQLKALARELNIPVLALSQLSRAVESRSPKIPILSDLRESGCLTGDTLVYLPDLGSYRRIDRLAGQSGFNVLALNTETWQLEPRPVLRAFSTGTKPVYQLRTRLGRILRATANHRFLTIQGWRRLDELAPGARLALPRSLPGPTRATMTDAELGLVGLLIGDGCTLARQPIHFTTSDRALAELAADLAAQRFGDALAPRISRERTWYQVYLAASRRLTHGVRNPVAAWLDELGVFNLRSHEKRVPGRLFAQPSPAIARFLRHLWATDGCIHLSQGVKHYAAIYYATSSVGLAHDVQSLLLRLGINARLARVSQRGKGRDQYHVIVSGKSQIELFFAQVGGLGRKKVVHQGAITEYLAVRPENTNRDIVPRDVWRLLAVPAMQSAGVTTRQMHAALGNAYCGTRLYKQNLSRQRALRLARAVDSVEIERLATSDVYWDEITGLEPAGEADVYDLTVEGLHNFVANDTIVHNSIEQDADVVIFIYRDDYYNKDSEKQGIAELHVAKHRNGPTGQVSLLFNHRTTKFLDLEVYRE